MYVTLRLVIGNVARDCTMKKRPTLRYGYIFYLLPGLLPEVADQALIRVSL
jgi:hypothetical protein